MREYKWISKYCLSMTGVVEDFKEEWQATRYMVGGKMFALVGGDKTGRPIVNVKLDPPDNEFLRGMYEDIVPGYYMNKVHWSSAYLDGEIPREVLLDMLQRARGVVFRALPKKAREALEAGE
ncbi:MAG: MmcQ/YjbR family DNA-binding protein [Deltaproteobacteria bacterium]|jgi:predicted DNA-binding protein (MmcQ/YjbR family)|nr:MmcQ/YjbR family DNA-binding protein [Deltaproteobacteria bacterium]